MKFTLIIFLALVPLLLIVSSTQAAKSKDAASHQSKSAADSSKAKQSASKSGGASSKKSAAAAAHQAKSAVAPGADSAKSKYGQLKAGEHKASPSSLEAKASKQSSAALAKEKLHLNQEAAKKAQNHHEATHSAKAASAAAAAAKSAAAAKESAAAAKAAEGKASHHPHHHHSEISSAKHLESAAAAPASKHGSEAVQGSAKAASAQLHQHQQQHSPSQSKSSAESSAAAAESSAKNHPHQKSPSSAAEAAAKKTAVDASKETSSAVKRNHNQYHHQTEYGQQPAYLTNTYHHPKPTYNRPNSYNHHNQHYSKPVHNVYHQEATYGQSQQYGNNDNYQQDTLIQANVIARLGDRTPFWLPRNDYYKEKDFPEGLNQLINVGKERLVNYGRVLRSRYQNLINNIKLKDITSQSASDRVTVESALALLAGLLPPVGSQVWSPSSSASGSYNVDELARLWQPNAVFTVEAQRDWKLSTEAPCRTAQLVENVTIIEAVPQLKHFLAVNREVIRRLEVLTGEDFTHDLSWLWIANVYDTYLSEAEYFGPAFYPPRWADERTLAVLREANQLKFSVWGHDQAYLRLRAGPLLQEITENLIKAAKDEATGSSLALYSTFDSNIAVIEHSLGVFRGGQAGYGSGLLIELHRDAYHKGAEPVVALFSVDVPSGVKITQIDLSRSARFAKHCYSAGPNCPLSSFVVALQNHLLTLAEAEVKCNNN